MSLRRVTAAVFTFGLLVPAAAQAVDLTPPMQFPGRADTGPDWILGVREGTPVPAGVRDAGRGTFVVAREQARSVAAGLRRSGALIYAEPDRKIAKPYSAFDTNLDGWARGAVVASTFTPPAPANAAAIAVIDDFVDPRTPDLASNVGYLNADANTTLGGPHGTEVASAAAAILQGTGVAGVLPGAPIASYGITYPASCDSVVEGIYAAIKAQVKIINMSLGGPEPCFAQYLAVQRAYGVGILVVAAAGNEFQEGNPTNYPAAFPHVVSVAALNMDLTPAEFSTANAAVDIAAPGVDVPMATVPEFDDDGSPDGFTLASGTSFAAPMVAGGAAWVRTVRPDLSVGQLGDVLRFSARDVAGAGYDANTGWGLMDIAAAVSLPAPRDDPIEPNDDILFVDGRAFNTPDRVRWNGKGRSTLSATSDQVEDPIDVYRIRFQPRSKVSITLSTSFGQAQMAVYDRAAKAVSNSRLRVCGPNPNGCVLTYPGRRSAIAYVAVAAGGSQSLNATYTLKFKRL